MNKNGWGLRKELAFILLFVVCLIISLVGLSQFSLLDNPQNGSSYGELERKLNSAALKYYNSNYSSNSDVVIISLSTLKNKGYISKFEDANGIECDGYVKIINTNVGIPYIRCFSYKTSGYDVDYE